MAFLYGEKDEYVRDWWCKEVSNTERDKVDRERKTRIDSIELNPRQKMFVENYLFNGNNGTKAYMAAYENENERSSAVRASELLKRDKISKQIATRQAELKEHHLTHIASGEDVLQFYTQVMINPDNKLDHRMKAGEYIGKSMGLFIDRIETVSETEFNIRIENELGKRLDVIDMQSEQMIEHEEE